LFNGLVCQPNKNNQAEDEFHTGYVSVLTILTIVAAISTMNPAKSTTYSRYTEW